MKWIKLSWIVIRTLAFACIYIPFKLVHLFLRFWVDVLDDLDSKMEIWLHNNY